MRIVNIKYEWWSGHPCDRFWVGIFDDSGEVYDYNTKENLKAMAEKDGYSWKVFRHHRDGRISVVESGGGDLKD